MNSVIEGIRTGSIELYYVDKIKEMGLSKGYKNVLDKIIEKNKQGRLLTRRQLMKELEYSIYIPWREMDCKTYSSASITKILKDLKGKELIYDPTIRELLSLVSYLQTKKVSYNLIKAIENFKDHFSRAKRRSKSWRESLANSRPNSLPRFYLALFKEENETPIFREILSYPSARI